MLKNHTKPEDSNADLSYLDKRKIVESSDEEELEGRVLGKSKKYLLRQNSEIKEDSENELELNNEGTEDKSDKERDLENLVFGATEFSLINNTENLSKRDKRIKNFQKQASIGENLERKPAWNDDADDEMYSISLFKSLINLNSI